MEIKMYTPSSFKELNAVSQAAVARMLGISPQNYGNLLRRHGDSLSIHVTGDSVSLIKSEVIHRGSLKPASKNQS